MSDKEFKLDKLIYNFIIRKKRRYITIIGIGNHFIKFQGVY